MVIPIISPFISPVCLLQKLEFWTITVDYWKLNILALIAAAVSDVVSLLEQINMSSDKWGHWFSKGFLSHPIRKEDQKQSTYTWKGQDHTFAVSALGYENSPSSLIIESEVMSIRTSKEYHINPVYQWHHVNSKLLEVHGSGHARLSHLN